jgi:hypothetical protein
MFNYHCGTAKFDVKIFNGTQCQKKCTSVEWITIPRIKDLYVIAYL